MSHPAPHEQIMALTVGFWQSRALAVAAELELADALAGGPLGLMELASRVEANPAMLRRLLRALETVGIFQQPSTDVFSNTETSETLRRNVPGSQWAWVISELSPNCGIYELWSTLSSVVRTGEAHPEQVLGTSFWGFLKQEPKAGRTFALAMQEVAQAMTPAVTAAYNWRDAEFLVDVGGGIGSQLIDILEHYPRSRGILLDEPHVLAGALQHDRLESRSGDFFQEVPEGADLYLMRNVLHDWSDEKAAAILSTVRKAAKPEAKLVLAEMVLPDGPKFSLGKWADLLMAVVFTGGKERTEAEYEQLLMSTGWRLDRSLPTQSALRLIVATTSRVRAAFDESTRRQVLNSSLLGRLISYDERTVIHRRPK